MDELKALRKAGKDAKAGDRLPVCMAGKRGDSIRKIVGDFGGTYSAMRARLAGAKGGLTSSTTPKCPETWGVIGS